MPPVHRAAFNFRSGWIIAYVTEISAGGSPVQMSTTEKKPLSRRFLKFMLGTDELSIAIAIVGASVALGNIWALNIIDISTRPTPPWWEALALGLVLSLVPLFAFFLSLHRSVSLMSPWKAVSVYTAAMLLPVVMQRMSVLGRTDPLALVGCGVAFILIAVPFATWIMQKRKGAADASGSSGS